MKILSLRLKNNFLGWDFDEVDFSSNLTLFVGVSGAGKTQILQGIIDLNRVANGKSINGFEWKIKFLTVNNTEFIWEGCFDTFDIDTLYFDHKDEEAQPPLLYEKLTSNSQVFIDRNKEKITYKDNLIPKLSSHQSIIYLLQEEKDIAEVFNALNKIEYRDHAKNRSGFRINMTFLNLPKNKYTTLESIINSDEDIRVKLFLVYTNKLDMFKKIKSSFINIFQQIEDIKSIPLETESLPLIFTETIPVIYIKEKDVPKWIREDRMSSGMLRTIIHLAEIFLSSKGTVILIDEFENSLGINCLDILTDDLIHENKNLQFIATSHHPYIINNIPYEYWKIVTRKGGHITIHDASDYNLGRSKQDAFIQLTKILEKQI